MDKNSISINIEFGTIMKTTLFFLLLFLLYFFQNLVLSILTAIVLASALEPLIHKIEKLKIPRVFATTAVYISLLAIMTGILLFFIPQLVEQGSNIYEKLPSHMQSLNT